MILPPEVRVTMRVMVILDLVTYSPRALVAGHGSAFQLPTDPRDPSSMVQGVWGAAAPKMVSPQRETIFRSAQVRMVVEDSIPRPYRVNCAATEVGQLGCRDCGSPATFSTWQAQL